jgi:phosphonate transport system substrate-binding protein
MSEQDKGLGVLQALGISQWLAVDQEQMEFMIDLMDTLAP